MRLLPTEKNDLLRRLPDLKLSYDNIHKKVPSEMYYLIPKGKKHLVWFTYFEDKKVCIFMEITPGSQKSIDNIYIVPQIFEKKLALGTIFYGTLFTMNENKFFSLENIHYYKGRNVQHNDENFKLNIIQHIFNTELKQSIITKIGVCFGLPIIESSFDNALSCAKQLPYEISSIQNRNFHSTTNLYNSTLYKTTYDTVDADPLIFSVKPDIQNDIYHLYVKNKSNGLELYDIAAIPDYKTSVMMNSVFRIIKENDDLDALEESDDEAEFENMNEDKFVHLDKCVKMECVYSKKFDKYIPLKIAPQGNIISRQSIQLNKSQELPNSTKMNYSSQQRYSNKSNQNIKSKY